MSAISPLYLRYISAASPLHLRYISAISPPYLLLRLEVDLLDAEGVVDDGAREEHLGRYRGDMGEMQTCEEHHEAT